MAYDTINHEVERKICFMLLAHGFLYESTDGKLHRDSTGCWFSLEEIRKYKSVLDFQLEYPYYSIDE